MTHWQFFLPKNSVWAPNIKYHVHLILLLCILVLSRNNWNEMKSWHAWLSYYCRYKTFVTRVRYSKLFKNVTNKVFCSLVFGFIGFKQSDLQTYETVIRRSLTSQKFGDKFNSIVFTVIFTEIYVIFCWPYFKQNVFILC